MRWEEWGWTERDTGGGGATRCPGWRSPLPNAILQTSRGEEGGENQVGGAWGRLEDGGSWQSLFSFDFVKVLKTCEPGVGGIDPCTSFWPSWRGRDEPDESESFVIFSVFAC